MIRYTTYNLIIFVLHDMGYLFFVQLSEKTSEPHVEGGMMHVVL